MKKLFQNRTVGSYLGLLAAILAIGTAIAMFAYGQSVNDFVSSSFAVLVAGCAVALVSFITDLPILPVAPSALYILACGLYLKRELMTISNHFNKIGMSSSGSAFEIIMLFLGLMLVATILAVISSFFDQKKS